MFCKKRYFFSFFLIILTIFTRFYGLKWGSPYYFHPDENNMFFSLSQLSLSDLNPNFFAYGQFPLYLAFFTFGKTIFALRLWSAIFSCLSIYVFYLLGKKYFKKNSWIFVLFLIFNPGLIQLAHFGTTESILIFVFATNIYLSILLKEKFNFKYLLFASLVSGIGIATKPSALIFIFPILLSLIISHHFLFTIHYLLLTICFSFIFSPYYFLAFSDFINTFRYEVNIANGKIPIFYTRQFIGTTSYLFQFQKIFPYVCGIPIMIYSFFGIFKINKKIKNISLILIPVLFFFFYQGQLFVKWTRFMSPIFFIFPFLAVFFIQNIKNYYLRYCLILLAILPGLFFMKLYFYPDIRIQADRWITQNITKDSSILSESANVYDLPINNQANYNIISFDFYHQEESKVPSTDYVIIPSRRVFMNIKTNFHQKLFSSDSNYREIKKFVPNNYFFLDDEQAEETWTVFDRPTIRIYEKIK